MSLSSRRLFLKSSALALATPLLAAPKLTTVGVQLYTVRSVIGKDTAGTLKAIDEIGYREAEAIWENLAVVTAELKKTRIKPVSVHFDLGLFKPENSGKLEEGIGLAKELGYSYAVYPYVRPADRHGVETLRALADTLNLVGAQCRAQGLALCYHNHAFEFEPGGAMNGMELLMSRTDPKLVGWEMDMFWVSVSGNDPVALLKKYAGRVPLLHLKDRMRDLPVQYTESVPKGAFQEVGSGSLDIPAVLGAAKAAGVKHYFVEQDQTAGDPVASLRKSFQYLQG